MSLCIDGHYLRSFGNWSFQNNDMIAPVSGLITCAWFRKAGQTPSHLQHHTPSTLLCPAYALLWPALFWGFSELAVLLLAYRLYVRRTVAIPLHLAERISFNCTNEYMKEHQEDHFLFPWHAFCSILNHGESEKTWAWRCFLLFKLFLFTQNGFPHSSPNFS